MNKSVEEIVSVLMYQGPTIEELLSEIVIKGNEFLIDRVSDKTLITVKSVLPYKLLIEDKYIYDAEGKLIKQILLINGKEKSVFDKFKEAQEMLDGCNLSSEAMTA